MNVACPYHQHTRPECVLIDVVDDKGGAERIHTNPLNNQYFVWQPPLHTNAVSYGDRLIAQPLEDHLVPSTILPGDYLSAFGRLRNRQKALRVLHNLQSMGFVVAWDQKYFGVAFPREKAELGDRLLDLHATGPIELDERFIELFRDYYIKANPERHPDMG